MPGGLAIDGQCERRRPVWLAAISDFAFAHSPYDEDSAG
jgi:hypothetical protein